MNKIEAILWSLLFAIVSCWEKQVVAVGSLFTSRSDGPLRGRKKKTHTKSHMPGERSQMIILNMSLF